MYDFIKLTRKRIVEDLYSCSTVKTVKADQYNGYNPQRFYFRFENDFSVSLAGLKQVINKFVQVFDFRGAISLFA